MKRRGLLGWLLVSLALAALPAAGFAAEEHSLLTPDGTLHVVRAGRAVDLGATDAAPDDYVIDWSSRSQDGSISTALIPGTDSGSYKRNLQLAFDEQTATLLVLWTEEMSPYSQVRVGVLHGGSWLNSGLLPNHGISGAYNPRMLLTHQTVSHLDDRNNVVTTTSSILSVIWWEDAQYGQARYATLFLDENGFDPTSLAIYDLPALLGSTGETPYGDVPSGSYLFPSLQADGLAGAVLASFADLHARKHRVVRITYPGNQGKPSDPSNVDWKRRHIPIVGIASDGPLAQKMPKVTAGASGEDAVTTTIGSGYRPTMCWRDGNALRYTRLEGSDWAPVRSIALDDVMTYEKALSLVTGMAQRN
jgi:hypothetical protein